MVSVGVSRTIRSIVYFGNSVAGAVAGAVAGSVAGAVALNFVTYSLASFNLSIRETFVDLDVTHGRASLGCDSTLKYSLGIRFPFLR